MNGGASLEDMEEEREEEGGNPKTAATSAKAGPSNLNFAPASTIPSLNALFDSSVVPALPSDAAAALSELSPSSS